MKRYLILAVVGSTALALASCSGESNANDYTTEEINISEKLKGLTAVDTLKFSLDSETAPNHYYGKIFEHEDSVYYVVFNDFKNSLQFFSLDSQNKRWELYFDKQGPNGLHPPERFFVQNFDSIFFMNGNSGIIQIFDSSGIKNYHEHLKLEGPLSNYSQYLDNFYEFAYEQNTKTISFWIYPLTPSYRDYNYWRKSKAALYSVPERKISITFSHFSDDYLDGKGLYEGFEFINSYITEGFRVIYFHNSHEIFIYDHLGNEIKKLKMPIETDEKITDPIMKAGEDRPTFDEIDRYMMEANYCARMFTNKQGSYHFRIIKTPASYDMGDGKKRSFYDKPFKIIVLDKDFRIVAEKEFKGGDYDFYQAFSIADKLYLSLNNPLNEIFSDDYMQFQVFQIR